jgi:hypothetical protein
VRSDLPRRTARDYRSNRAGSVAFFVISKLLNLFVLVIMLLSEFAPPKVVRFYDNHFPILGSGSGVGWLGMLQIWIASNLLTQS